MEPASWTKRRHLSEALRGSERSPGPTADEVARKLREIRDHSLANLDSLVAKLTAGSWSGGDLDVTFASDAKEAVDAILRIAEGTEIAINKSAVVANELVPLLTASGHDVITSYLQEFASPESDPVEYWQLPGMTFEARFDSFMQLADLAASRTASIEINGTQDLTALLGVNAISADGTIVMLQHMQNIRKVFEQARDVIFVAGIDKIVTSPDDAVFQTRCMAVFGSEVLPLTLGPGKSQSGLDKRPLQRSSQPGKVSLHLIVLDNGRSGIARSRYRDLMACIDCRACTKGCPASQLFVANKTLSPKEYLYFTILGENPSLDRCLQCKTCEANCPLGIEVPRMIVEVKAELAAKTRPALVNLMLSRGGSMQRWGSRVAPLANLVLGSRVLRWLGDVVIGVSRERRLPALSSRSFVRWYRSRTARG